MDQQMANVFLRMSVLMDRGALHAEAVDAGRVAGQEFTESFKENIKSLAIGFIGFEGAKEGLEAVVGGASELAEATDRAKVAAENAGLSWGAVEDAMKGAESAGEKLGFTNVQIADTYGLLVTRTGDVNKANLELAEAEDVSRFRHLSLADAADKVNRANQGNAKALKDLNIILPANASEAEKAAAVTKFFAEQQGQATEYTKSLAGQTAIMRAQFDDAAAALGTSLTPALKTATSFFIDHNKAILVTAGLAGGLFLAYKGVTAAQALTKLATDTLSGAIARESQAERQAALNTAALADAKAKQALETAKAAAASSEDAVVLAELAVAEDEAAAAAGRLSTAETIAAGTSGGLAGSIAALATSPAGAVVALVGLTEIAGKLAEIGAKATPRVEQLTVELDGLAKSGGKIDVSSVAEADKHIRDIGDVVDRIAKPGVAARIADLPLVSGHLTGTNDQLKKAKELVSNLDEALAGMVQSGHPEQAAAALKAVEQGMSPAQIQRLTSLLPGYSDAISKVGREAAAAAPQVAALSSESLGLADAEAALTDHWKQTADAVQSAKDSLAAAQDTEVKGQDAIVTAQDAVNKARQQAAQNIRDLQQATEGLSAAEGDAADKLEHARRAEAAAARLDPNSLRAREIRHQLGDAQSAYDDALNRSAKNRADLADAERKGIENSDAVLSAKRALHTAQVEEEKDVTAVGKARGALNAAYDANSHAFDINTAAGRENSKMALAIKDAYEKLHPDSQTEATDLATIYTNLGIANTNMGAFLTNLGVAAQVASTLPTTTAETPAPRSEDYYGPTTPAAPQAAKKTDGGGFLGWIARHVGFFAGGGDLGEGVSMLGEQGPEFVQKTGSRVQVFRSGDAPTTPAAAGLAGGVHLHLTNVTVNDPVDVDMIIQKLQFAARRFG